jgi:hypothetical protein
MKQSLVTPFVPKGQRTNTFNILGYGIGDTSYFFDKKSKATGSKAHMLYDKNVGAVEKAMEIIERRISKTAVSPID